MKFVISIIILIIIIMYQVSCIMYHVSCVMYHVSCVMQSAMCHVSGEQHRDEGGVCQALSPGGGVPLQVG